MTLTTSHLTQVVRLAWIRFAYLLERAHITAAAGDAEKAALLRKQAAELREAALELEARLSAAWP